MLSHSMPILERDPWRFQFFEGADCPDNVSIPTDDPDCWNLYPRHRWIYDKLKIAERQGLVCGPHGVDPPGYPVFSKPMVNLKGMGIGSRSIASAAEMDAFHQPGHMWMPLLVGEHVSTDCAVENGRMVWSRHAGGVPWHKGMFKHWTIFASPRPDLESYLGQWIGANMAGYSGMMNLETIGGRIIEAHLRFADQWCDLYGKSWVAALVTLYAEGRWRFDDPVTEDGYSVPLFARHGNVFRHPPEKIQQEVLKIPGVTSLQITFHELKDPAAHPMPPGGFRLAIVNATDFAAACEARLLLSRHFASAEVFLPD